IGIFSIVVVSFITIFLVITRVQVRQASLAEVNGQSQYLLQELQYYIGRASLISIPQDTPTTTLELRMPDLAEDPTWITLQNGTLYLQQTASGTPQPLSSDKVTVSDLSFIRRANTPGHDSVSIAMAVAYNTLNVEQLFSESLQDSVARVSAASFDSGIYPSSTGLDLGSAGYPWLDIDNDIWFSGDKIGIGPANNNPQAMLDVAGGMHVSGNLGIGTTSPASLLTVYSNPTSYIISNPTVTTSTFVIRNDYDANGPNQPPGSIGPTLLLQNEAGYGIGDIDFQTTNQGTSPVQARWQAADDGNYSAAQIFYGASGGQNGTLQPRLYVGGSNPAIGVLTLSPSTTLQVAGSNATVFVGSASLPGCLEMGNSDGSGGINYITVLNGVLTATMTKPANCQ
ncbi:MAG: hypothetical protein KGJ13_03940, partial [Patescibacteria group bacterium]|nr:hypothetical protein [Patescibacteria group bacterium]